MNIFLTSYGIDTRYSDYMDSYYDIINILTGKRVAIIPNAKLQNEDRTNSKVAKDELNKNNIQAEIVDIVDDYLDINDYNALYLSGGEPKNLIDSINKANLYNKIKKFVDNGGVIIGQSAGAMIFSKNYYDTTTGNLLVMNNGYDYSDKMIVPHYNNLPDELKKQIPDDVIKINDNDKLIKLKEVILMHENKISFNWYPGHMEKTKRKIKEIEGLIDIVLELADARIPMTSRLNRDFLKNKDSILILTKYDLCDKEKTDKLVEELKKTYKDVICTYIGDKTIKSKIKNIAEKILKEKIEKRENKGLIKRKIRAIVVGIPNVGKSTLINTLCGKTVAKAENRPGVTRSLEWLKISPDFEFIDSPGILGKKFSSQEEAFRLASLSSVNEAILNYQDLAIFIYEELRDKYPSRFLEFYKMDSFTDFLTDIEKIAKRKGCLLKGGVVDIDKAYLLLYQDFKNNKYGKITLD